MAPLVAQRAAYDDLVKVPDHLVAEIIDGSLVTHPRPRLRHALVASALGGELFSPFQKGQGGPGGWWILDEPELHYVCVCARACVRACARARVCAGVSVSVSEQCSFCGCDIDQNILYSMTTTETLLWTMTATCYTFLHTTGNQSRCLLCGCSWNTFLHCDCNRNIFVYCNWNTFVYPNGNTCVYFDCNWKHLCVLWF